ncbi:hypothetical protein [Nonomuraea glycinis]|uniref:hypothetical protein n=1 Tax=Nonomuraea glycinis TaxID=2047744 RepID=UPI002E132F26|nr:hypothetical protein OHA68_23105 [Nonomuraea glycinis]
MSVSGDREPACPRGERLPDGDLAGPLGQVLPRHLRQNGGRRVPWAGRCQRVT